RRRRAHVVPLGLEHRPDVLPEVLVVVEREDRERRRLLLLRVGAVRAGRLGHRGVPHVSAGRSAEGGAAPAYPPCVNGRTTSNTAPCVSARFLANKSPPCSRTIPSETASPSPVPRASRRVLANGSNSRETSSGSIPGPLSVTVSETN